ncbi:MAG TPA: RrF2 family transcriptional regulator [Candidatus Hypogeohydataceae bacterium YC40]
MKLSSQTEYAILALMELGQRYGKGYVLSREIAQSREIPISFLERILLTLRNSGVIVSLRGARGGHCLARDPKDVNIKSVIEIFEGGSLAPSDCVDERLAPTLHCPLEASCVIRDLWKNMYSAMLQSVENVTLNILLEQERIHQPLFNLEFKCQNPNFK